jgi:hypothetical protein
LTWVACWIYLAKSLGEAESPADRKIHTAVMPKTIDPPLVEAVCEIGCDDGRQFVAQLTFSDAGILTQESH